jgi:hypothetical protein
MVRTTCGIPTFIPSTTLGFDIESVDYKSDEVPNLRFLQSLPPPSPPPTTTTSTTTTSPTTSTNTRKRLPRSQQMPRRTIVTQIIDGIPTFVAQNSAISGPVSARYNPDFDRGKKMFKSGFRGPNDSTCEARYSMVFVTTLRGLNVNVATEIYNNFKRDLQSLPPPPPPPVTNTMMISFGAEGFSGASRVFVSLLAIACSALMMF